MIFLLSVLLLASHSQAFIISINNVSQVALNATSTVNYIAFMYPYEVFEIFSPLEPDPEYLLTKIDDVFSTTEAIRETLASLPRNIMICKGTSKQVIRFKALTQQDFLIQEYNNEAITFQRENSFLTFERDLKLLSMEIKSISELFQKGKDTDTFMNFHNSNDQKSTFLFSINVNFFNLLLHANRTDQISDSVLTGVELASSPLDSKCDISFNGSTFRFVVIDRNSEKEVKFPSSNLMNLTLFDRGFNSNHYNPTYKMQLTSSFFQNSIRHLRVFPIDMESFYLLVVDDSSKLWLFDTSLQSIHLVSTYLPRHNPNNVSFADVFTQKFPLISNPSTSIYVNYLGVIDGIRIKFKLIEAPLVANTTGGFWRKNNPCSLEFGSERRVISVDKVSEQLVAVCFDNNVTVSCQLISIYCNIVQKIENIDLVKERVWSQIQDPYQSNKSCVQLWLRSSQTEYRPALFSETCVMRGQEIEIMKSTKLGFLDDHNNQTARPSPSSTKTIVSDYSFFKRLSLASNFSLNVMKESFKLELKEWEKVFMPEQAYESITKYQYTRGCRLLESRINSSLGNETVEEQEGNCELTTKIVNGIEVPTGVRFSNDSSWKVCRVGIQVKFDHFVLSEPRKKVRSPYLMHACGMSLQNHLENCIYIQKNFTKRFYLSSKHLNIFFFINQGETYDLTISDINKEEMQRVTSIFLYMLFLTIALTGLFCLVIVLRPFCMYLMLYWGLSEQQPNYSFPLNYFELQIRIKRMVESKLIKESDEPLQEHDDCGFCLEDKMQIGQSIIEVYCHHTFHSRCFRDWIRQQNRPEAVSCPICKRKITLQGLNLFKSQARSDLGSSQLEFQ